MNTRSSTFRQIASARAGLLAGGVATLLASTCCLGPLVLLMLGFSGAWIGNLTVLEPYRPLFVGAAALALLLAWRGIFGRSGACTSGEVCALPPVNRAYRVLFWAVAVLLVLALVFPYLAHWFY